MLVCRSQATARGITLAQRHSLIRFAPRRSSVVAMAKDALAETSDGAFKRTESTFRNHVSKDGDFKPEGA